MALDVNNGTMEAFGGLIPAVYTALDESQSDVSEETVIATVTAPLASIKVNQLWRFGGFARCAAVNASEEAQIRVRIEDLTGTELIDFTAINPAAGDETSFEGTIHLTALAASGTANIRIRGQEMSTPATIDHAYYDATVDTTSGLSVVVTVDHSDTGGNTTTVEYLYLQAVPTVE